MTEPQPVTVFLNRIAGELTRLKNQAAIVSENASLDLSPLVRKLEATLAEARKLARQSE